jgi:ATP-dependent helicase/nuclease subunit B
MANPIVIFLDHPGSLAEQVAGVLLEGLEGHPYDLTATEVWVPTAGAARRIRHKLAELSAKRGGGVLSPKFSKPMAALLPRSGKGGVIASRVDREAAWGLVLRDVDKSTVATLFPSPEVLEGEQFLVGAGAMMCELCDRLAEGGKTPLHPKIIEVCSDDVGRWQEMDPLYRSYLSVLSRHGLQDPNELKIRGEEGSLPSMKRLFIACVPDLQSVAEKRAARLMEQGVEVCVLVWKPRPMDGQFDPWGRPKTGYWIDALIPLQPDQIQMAKDPADEAAGAVEFLVGAGGSHAIVLGDPKLSATFQAEILRRGGSPFLPEGRPLARTEAAVVAAEWIKFRADQSLRTLRRLLELPGFSAWIGARCGLSLHELLACCDYLTIDLLAESLSQAESFLVGTSRAKETRFLGILSASLALGTAELLKEIWAGKADLVEDVLDACAEVKSSPVARTWPEAVDPLLLRSFSRRSVYGSSKPTDTDLAGWLEAPWCDAQRLAVCGCVEGSLPSSLDGHPFLPDAVRGSLGIADNSSLRARDHYLLACLIHSQEARPHGKILCSFSKFGPDGSPSTPSGLLMRCPSEQLPERVIRLFQKSASGVARPKRKPEWRWSLPQVAQRGEPRISPTDFKKYLECPFRFYLSRRLGLETHDQGAREMHPGQFGELIHGALQRFAEHSRDETDRNKISKAVLGHLDDLTMEMFGSDPSPAVRVQIQAAKIRLQSFARVQHGLRNDGWKMIAWEKKIEAGALGSSLIGGLPLSGKIDRIDEHDEKGLRVIDYKTQGKLITPQKAHFASRSFLEQARVPGEGRALYWKDLQLPIYRMIVEALNPGRPIEAAYLALTADPQESRILSLPLNEGLMESAQRCAEEVGSRVRRGVFWPPQSLPSNARDPYDVLFKDGTFEQCIDEATIAFLKGVEDTLP